MLASSISQGSGAGWPGVLFRGPTWLTARLRMSSDLCLLILSDRQAVAYVLNGLQHGFRLGFQPARKLKHARKNKPSAFQNPKVIDDYLATEVAHGRVAGPFPSPPLPNLQVSSFGVIPKKGQPGKWRLIVDLSSPHGSSVNDGIDADEFSCTTFTWTR